MITRRDRRAGAVAEGGGARGARLTPAMPEAADAVPGLLPHRPVAMEAWTRGWSACSAPGAATRPSRPCARAVLAVRRDQRGKPRAEARAAAARLIADAGCLDSLVVTGAPARALWASARTARRLGSRTTGGRAVPGPAGRTPPSRPGSWAPTLRDFAALMAEHGLDGLSYGHFGDGCVHIRIDFRSRPRRAANRRFVVAAAQLVGKYGGSISRRSRRRPPPAAIWLPAMYSAAEAIEVMAAVKAIFDPGNVLNPVVLVIRPAGRGPARAAGRPLNRAPRSRARLRLLPRRRRTCPPRCNRCVGVANAGAGV